MLRDVVGQVSQASILPALLNRLLPVTLRKEETQTPAISFQLPSARTTLTAYSEGEPSPLAKEPCNVHMYIQSYLMDSTVEGLVGKGHYSQ